jgi:hypothetical protein
MTPQPPDFRDLIGDDVPGAERERLHRVHDLLVAAGPPPELPPTLERAPATGASVSFLPRRRRGALLVLAAALAAAAFGAGYLTGHRTHETKAAFTVEMHGTAAAPNALASLRLDAKDSAGNWPMVFTVRGLQPLPRGGYYVLFLTRKGKLAANCGSFNVHGEKTIVHLNAPYKLKTFDGWVVTRHLPGKETSAEVLLTT